MAMSINTSFDDRRLNPQHWLWLGLAAMAWLIEAYDIGIMGAALVPLHHVWQLTAQETGLLAISSTIGIVIGVIPAGFLIDRYGRKRVMIVSLIFYSIVTVVTGLAGSWQILALLRGIAGIGLGAMFPIPYTLLSELSPKRRRGMVAGILDAFLSVGYFVPPLVASWALPALGYSVGWRILFFGAGLGLIFAWALAKWLPESPRWLMTKGRVAEAEKIMGGLHVSKAMPGHQEPFQQIFTTPYLKRTVMLWISFPSILFMFYAIMSYMPSILVREGFSSHNAELFASVIMAASIPGKFLEAYLVERWGRKIVIVAFSVLGGLSALAFPFVQGFSVIVLLGVSLAFFGISVDPAIKVFTAEQYPTTLRGKGVAFTEGVGRLIGGALAPYLMALILADAGASRSFELIAAIAGLGALAVGLMGQETQGLPLEEYAVAPRPLSALTS